MTEQNREVFSSDKEWFLNYINRGGIPPSVTPKNYLGARIAVVSALDGHKSFQGRQLDSLRRVIKLTQGDIKANTLEKKRPLVLKLLRRYPSWSLRMQELGERSEGFESVEGVVVARPVSDALIALLGEAARRR